jgi:carboxyl-terminal processing protease
MTFRPTLAAACAAVLLTACGGGGGSAPVQPPLSCTVPDQNAWLRDFMDRTYFWYALAPRPAPAAFASLQDYFDASLFQGDATFPSDRYSYFQSTESFNRFFGDGQTLGYGLFVAGVEVEGRPDLPLRVRYIEPRSDAATQGLQRGEQILSVNGRPASELIANDDFEILTPANAGDRLQLLVRGSGGDRGVTLTAAVYALTPVTQARVVSSPLGKRMGYVVIKDMIDQVDAPLDTAFRSFLSNGVTEVVLDLRYNGGGFVRTGGNVASHVGGSRTSGRDYVSLLYNDQQSNLNQTVRFGNPAAALGLSRVYVLTGPRTCSASEQVISGLSPFVQVVQIGDTTCGKPVGFLAQDNTCGSTFSVVNFESVNAANQGRYFDGLGPSCSVADDLDRPLGDPEEGLLAAARLHADTGVCPPTARRAQPLAARHSGGRRVEPGENSGMYMR